MQRFSLKTIKPLSTGEKVLFLKFVRISLVDLALANHYIDLHGGSLIFFSIFDLFSKTKNGILKDGRNSWTVFFKPFSVL